jgi:hypothetical protein
MMGMKIKKGNEITQYGPGVDILLTGDEVATAIHSYLMARGVHISGARTTYVNGLLCQSGHVYVDPSGFVISDGNKINGRNQ